jgi:hypothetical protein
MQTGMRVRDADGTTNKSIRIIELPYAMGIMWLPLTTWTGRDSAKVGETVSRPKVAEARKRGKKRRQELCRRCPAAAGVEGMQVVRAYRTSSAYRTA